MRVITGTARGKRLCTLKGEDIRPTTDRVKEGLFSSIQFDVPGARVLDLFAGSGQLGIEALSRGAAFCVFVDRSNEAQGVIQKNLQTAGVSDRARQVLVDARTFLQTNRERFDLVFLDPPYACGLLEETLPLLSCSLSDRAKVICEHLDEKLLPQTVGGLRKTKSRRYGKIRLCTYEQEKE